MIEIVCNSEVSALKQLTKGNGFLKRFIFNSILVTIILSVVACGSDAPEEERIKEEFEAFSVHLYTGLKLIIANPENNPEIEKAKASFNEILESNAKEVNPTISLADMARLAKLGYEAKSFGEKEVALGRENTKLFFIRAGDANKKSEFATPPNDHALTLALLFAGKIAPGSPLLVSDKAMLYEAWMSEGLNTSDKSLDGLLMSIQAATYAQNEYCKMGDSKTEHLKEIEIKALDPMTVAFAVTLANTNSRAAAHIGKENIIAMFLPEIIEVLPGAARTYAHLQLANCFGEQEQEKKALVHQEHAIDAIAKFGIPSSELAILKAGVAYKAKDYEQVALHLKDADKSLLLDARTKKDLKQLSEELESDDNELAKKYFSSAYFGLIVTKIVNQRLLDSGVYDALLTHPQFKTFLQMYEGINKIDTSDVLKEGKGLLDSL